MVQTEMTAGAQRSKAKTDVALARQALGLAAEPGLADHVTVQ